MEITTYQPAYAMEITDLFHASVHNIAVCHYLPCQLEAWAPTPPDYSIWAGRLNQNQTFLALDDALVIGFIALEKDGHIDCLYTHKDYQRRGVATELYLYAEAVAKRRGLKRLSVIASHLARPFFEGQGFDSIEEKTVIRNKIGLTCFRMEKELGF